MALKDYEKDMLRCARCSECKWVPLAQVKSWRFGQCCPSIGKYNFHAYSASGKLIMGLEMLTDRIGYTEGTLDILYKDPMCGACDVSCKCTKDMEPLAVVQELRIKAVEDGQLLPQHIPIIDSLKKEDNMMQRPKAERGRWAEGIDVKDITQDRVPVFYHAGCRYSFVEEFWPVVRATLTLLKNAGVDVGIAGREETCCGGRAYEMGYQGEFIKYAEHTTESWKTAGVQTVVTSCAECYHAFKVLYPKMGKKSDVQVLHITEYLDRMIKEGRIKLTKDVSMVVTYQDPCHLGRLGEPYIPWEGIEKKVLNQLYIYDPPKPWRRGTKGVYEPPRNVLRSIPGVKLVEMERTKEYAWCCGAGGGVKDAYPDFALWTALERIEEVKATGAEAIVTACPWCKSNLSDAVKEAGERIKVYDIVELLQQAL